MPDNKYAITDSKNDDDKILMCSTYIPFPQHSYIVCTVKNFSSFPLFIPDISLYL